MTIRFLISRDAKALAEAIRDQVSATVEAEYGDVVVEGSAITLAHHGPRKGNPPPCISGSLVVPGLEVVGLSHVDLDAVGGCMALLERKSDVSHNSFWDLAAYIDLNGMHKVGEYAKLHGSEYVAQDIRRLWAWEAWDDDHKVYPPSDGVEDVSTHILAAADILDRILKDDAELLAAGDTYCRAQDELNADSFINVVGGVVIRSAPTFTNHLYNMPDGRVGKAVVAYNTRMGSITISLADPVPGVDCEQLVQHLWGDEAGGHRLIGGGPRNTRMAFADFEDAVETVRQALRDNL